MPTGAVVFDLDGTLVDTMTSAPRAYADTIRFLGGPAVSPDEVVAAWHIGATPAVLAHFLTRPASLDDIECFYGHFEAAVATVQPFPGVVEMLDTLDREGYRLGVFTSATRRAATLMLAIAGLDAYFPTVVCGDEVSEPKPRPQGLQRASEHLGVEVAATAYVGDAEVDIRCAVDAGALAIHAAWGAPSLAVERIGAVERIRAVEGVSTVAHSPSDVPAQIRAHTATG